MDTAKGVLLLLVVLLAGVSFVLFIQYSAANSRLADATGENDVTLALIKMMGTPCSAVTGDFSKTAECIRPLLQQKNFKEDGFGKPDTRKPSPGFLVIKNTNAKPYDAERFTFFVNRELTQTGCTITGSIKYNDVCRFNFNDPCEKGTILEVFYPVNSSTGTNDVRVFSKNC